MSLLKFDVHARNALSIAQQIAQELRHNYIGSEHVLYGILSQPQDNLPFQMTFIDSMSNAELLDVIRRIGMEHLNGVRNTSVDSAFVIPEITEELQQCLDAAMKIAESYNFPYIGLEHLVYGILNTNGCNGQRLMSLDEERSRKIKEMLVSVFENYKQGVKAGEKNYRPKPTRPNTALDFFTSNLNRKLANEASADVVDREREIDRLIQILSRKVKNNPILLGEPGVGKTALVEGLAKRINQKRVPEWLQDKQILVLDISNILAGTMFRGEFEGRIKAIFEEVTQNKNIILFIDEIHTAIGAGAGAVGGPDLAQILKPALSRGEISVIGATTEEEYRRIVKKDKAFERRFQTIRLEEPNVDQVVDILRGVKSIYENYHNCIFPETLLPKLVDLADRFIPERFFPDKAIDLLDECLVRSRIQFSVQNQEDKAKEDSWAELEKQILILIKQKNEAILAQNFDLSKQIEDEQRELEQKLIVMNLPNQHNQPKSTVSDEVLERTVSEMSGVPLVRISSNIFTQVKALETSLGKQIFGQEEAISQITTALKRSYTGVNPHRGPIASFILLGPTGVGKTELVKVLTKELYGDPDKYLLKLDMSEFADRHNISRLLGAPAGYVGYDDAPQLTEFLRKKPYSVILFDEIEKGNREVLNILLQMLEDGRITDAKGNTVSCEHALIFMTSNLGRNQLNKFASKIGFIDFTKQEEESYENIKKQVMEEVQKAIKPEILGRINGKIVFRPIGKSVLRQILHKELSLLQSHMLTKNRAINFKDELDLIEFLTTKANDNLEYGAREVKALVANQVQDLISEFLLDNPNTTNIEITLAKDKNSISIKEKKTKVPIEVKVLDNAEVTK